MSVFFSLTVHRVLAVVMKNPPLIPNFVAIFRSNMDDIPLRKDKKRRKNPTRNFLTIYLFLLPL